MKTAAEVNLENRKLNCVTNPIYQSRFQKLEKALNELFLKELNTIDSIFIKISPNVVQKTAMFLSGLIIRPAAIGICGETASGKSTIVMDSMEMIENFSKEFFNKRLVTRINTDDYYYDKSEEVKQAGSFAKFAQNYDLDTPEAIELNLMKKHIKMLLKNKKVFLPKYDMSGTAIRIDNYSLAMPSSIIVSEGLYTLIDGISDIFDFKIYIDIDKSVQKKRFFERAEQRGLGETAEKVFENAAKKAAVYIHPCIKNADIVLNGQIQRIKYKNFVSSILEIFESIYYDFAV